ncbi:MAG: hypothetical protein RLZ68_2310 [Pseudomonadota bacterium]|jgi:hypothetical protein
MRALPPQIAAEVMRVPNRFLGFSLLLTQRGLTWR